jgi:hypothetical protein
MPTTLGHERMTDVPLIARISDGVAHVSEMRVNISGLDGAYVHAYAVLWHERFLHCTQITNMLGTTGSVPITGDSIQHTENA